MADTQLSVIAENKLALISDAAPGKQRVLNSKQEQCAQRGWNDFLLYSQCVGWFLTLHDPGVSWKVWGRLKGGKNGLLNG